MNRRTFFKRIGLGGAAFVLGGTAWRASAWWDQPAASGFRILSHQEVLISDAIAQALFPGEKGAMYTVPGGLDVGLTQFLDDLLVDMLDETMGNAIRVLMHAIDEAAILGGEGGISRFHKRPLDERIKILEAWDGSWLSARRGVFSALKIFYSMGYCEHPDVLKAVGIEFSCMTGQSAVSV